MIHEKTPCPHLIRLDDHQMFANQFVGGIGSRQRIWKKKVLVLNRVFWRIRVEKPPPKMDIMHTLFFWCDKYKYGTYELSGFRILKYKLHQVGGKKNIMSYFVFFEWLVFMKGLPSSWYALMRGADDHPLVFEPSCPDLNSWMGLIFWKVEQIRWW